MDVATLRTRGKVDGPKGATAMSICGSSGSDLVAVSFAREWLRNSQLAKMPVHVEMVDVASGHWRGSWDADDIPQSLSPDGGLAAVSDWEGGGPLLKLAVVDTNSGKKLAILDGGFEFKSPWRGRITGRVAGRFLNNKQIVLTPDDNFDRSGHHSGDCLRIVGIREGKTVQELKPRQFGPTGELRIASDGEEIVTASWYPPPSFYTHPHEPMPPDSVPELVVFLDKGRFLLEATIKSLGGGSHVVGSPLPFRVSSDGSVIAVAQKFGISVFERAGR